MRKWILSALLVMGCCSLASADLLEPKVDKKTQERILITTDLEVDDMNGIILSFMYADQYDLAGIVWTAGMYHFNGDGGEHKLAEITPNYKCNAQHCEHTVANAGELTAYRPADPTFLDRMLNYYEEDYKNLSQHSKNYPTPDYLRSITKVGNVEFEGDYRFETEGSRWIEQCILDDDMRPLHIQHWGGINTTVRALYSIYERYHGTPEWEQILQKVTTKVRLAGSGEDNCRKDSHIDEMFPGLKNDDHPSVSSYGQFFSALNAAPEVLPYYQGEYLKDAFKIGHGKLLGEFWLMAEGRAVFGEPLIYNYGLINYMDWGLSAKLGWGPASLVNYPRYEFDPFDWMCCQFGCSSYIDFGLRKDRSHRNNRYVQVYFDELAARADWAIQGASQANHAPLLTSDQMEFTAKAGKTVELSGKAQDPEGRAMTGRWWVEPEGKGSGMFNMGSTTFGGDEALKSCLSVQQDVTIQDSETATCSFTIPKSAKKGDQYLVNLEVQDQGERPMTRFLQYLIEVK